MARQKSNRKRRAYTDGFKLEAVKLVLEQGLSVAEAARNLGIHANSSRILLSRIGKRSGQHDQEQHSGSRSTHGSDLHRVL